MQKTTNFMYIWGGATPALAEAFWKIPSDFAETLNYSQLFLFSFFFPFPLLQNVRNKYFNSKWHCSALQRCGPGPFPRQPPVLFPAARCAAGAQPFSKRSHAREVQKHCRAKPSSGIRQAGLCIQKSEKIQSLVSSLGNLHAVCNVPARK